MSRAKWKGPFVPDKLLKLCKKNVKNSKTPEIYTDLRGSTIVPFLVGQAVNVHNGKNFSRIKITSSMVGRKLGEFSPTRKKFSFKKKKAK